MKLLTALAGSILLGATFAACATGSGETETFELIPTTSSTSSSSSTSSEEGGSGGAGASGGSGGEGGGAGSNACSTVANTCATADVLGEVCGDEDNDLLTVQGVGSKWFEVYVAECVSSPISFPDLSFTAIIDSPPGMNYDLYVYKGDDGGPNCSASPAKAAGVPERVMDGWGDSMGSEDGTWISLEVRYVSGSNCAPTDTWTLRVEGNT